MKLQKGNAFYFAPIRKQKRRTGGKLPTFSLELKWGGRKFDQWNL